MCESDTNTLHQLNASIDPFDIKHPQTASKSYEYADIDIDKPVPIPTRISWADIPESTPPPSPQPLPSITSNTLSASITSPSFVSPNYSRSLVVDDDDEESGSDIDTSEESIAITLGPWNDSFCNTSIEPSDVSHIGSLYDSEPENNDDAVPLTIRHENESAEDEEPDDISPASPPIAGKYLDKVAKDEDIKISADETSHSDDGGGRKYGDLADIYERGRFVPKQKAMLEIRDNMECQVKHHVHKLNLNAAEWIVFTKETAYQIIERILKERGIHLPDHGKASKPKRQRTMGRYYRFMPSRPKSMYYIPYEFTEKLPEWTKEKIPEKNVYEFIIKMLGVIKRNKPSHNDSRKVFDFGLNGIYFIAKTQDPTGSKSKGRNRYKPWIIDEFIISDDDTKQDEIVRPPKLLNDSEMRRVRLLMTDKHALIDTIKGTKWNKIPIYKYESSQKRMALFLTKEVFNKNCIEFIKKVDMTDTKLIPIIMFGHRDKYIVEYVWIIRIDDEKGIDIGMSFKLSESGDSVYVVGIYLDKTQILKQHHIISPSANHDILDNFRTIIDDFHIGNPDDDKNRTKDIQKRYDNVMDGLMEINKQFSNEDSF